jgi:hypothetical protein
VNSFVTDNPFAVAVAGTHQLAFTVQMNSGHQVNDTGYAGWSSSNTTVGNVGTSTGLVSGVAAGSLDVGAFDDNYPLYSQVCWGQDYAPPMCPAETGTGGDSPGTVTPTVSFIGGNDFIFEGTDPTVTNFNGQQVQGKPSDGTYSWSASSTSTYNPQVQFNGSPSTYSTTSGIVTLTVNGALSSSLLDTTLSVGYSQNSQSAQLPATKSITIRQFEYLVQSGSIQNVALNGPTYGFVSNIFYSVYTHPQGQLVTGAPNISVYEQVSLGQCNFPGPNLNTGTGGLNGSSQIADDLSIAWGQALPPSLSCAADQYLGVGGFIVRHNTINWSPSGPTITNLGPTS